MLNEVEDADLWVNLLPFASFCILLHPFACFDMVWNVLHSLTQHFGLQGILHQLLGIAPKEDHLFSRLDSK